MARKPTVANLKPWKKGQTGNPNGRPKKLPKLEELLADTLGSESNGQTAASLILNRLRKKAIAGDVRAAELLLNRAYGKPKETVDVTNRVINVVNGDEAPANDD